MNQDNVAIRLKGYMDATGLTSSQFADQCGIPRPSLSQLLSGRNKKISDVLVGQIHSAFPDLNILWLLFGEGEMLVTDSEYAQEPLTEDEDKELLDNAASPRQPISPRPMGKFEYEDPVALLDEKDRLIEELRKENEMLKKSPRKVAQITVYYDDSTFETFYPGNGIGRSR